MWNGSERVSSARHRDAIFRPIGWIGGRQWKNNAKILQQDIDERKITITRDNATKCYKNAILWIIYAPPFMRPCVRCHNMHGRSIIISYKIAVWSASISAHQIEWDRARNNHHRSLPSSFSPSFFPVFFFFCSILFYIIFISQTKNVRAFKAAFNR